MELVLDVKKASLVIPEIAGKTYDAQVSPLSIIKNSYFQKVKSQDKTILKDISFQLQRGERLGVLGPNGAGKTSLLRLLSKNILPTSGDVNVNGRTHSLMNLQMGLILNGTGVENIFLRGLQLGMSMKEIRQKMDGAIAFSGLGEHINRRFVTYSAGMKLRLAIAITLMPRPDVLIMDEWIGAGDKTFTNKLSSSLNEYVDNSRALIIASHNVNLIKRVCTHGILLDHGQMVTFGMIDDVLKAKQALDQKNLRGQK